MLKLKSRENPSILSPKMLSITMKMTYSEHWSKSRVFNLHTHPWFSIIFLSLIQSPSRDPKYLEVENTPLSSRIIILFSRLPGPPPGSNTTRPTALQSSRIIILYSRIPGPPPGSNTTRPTSLSSRIIILYSRLPGLPPGSNTTLPTPLQSSRIIILYSVLDYLDSLLEVTLPCLRPWVLEK